VPPRGLRPRITGDPPRASHLPEARIADIQRALVRGLLMRQLRARAGGRLTATVSDGVGTAARRHSDFHVRLITGSMENLLRT